VTGYAPRGEVGQGGLSVVLRTRCLGRDRLAALEFRLARREASPDDLQRFLQQAQILAGLDHPHLVPVYEVGEHQGQPYFIVTLVEGGLARRLEDRATPAEVLLILVQVSSAVRHAHQQDALRKNLQPGRVLLDDTMIPYLDRAGLAAKQARGAAEVAELAAILVAGRTELSPSSSGGMAEVDALGTILSGCLERQTEQPREFDTQAARHLEVVALKCQDLPPGRPCASAGVLAGEVERWLRGEPVQARLVGPLPRPDDRILLAQ
jgi:serine/threonine-protein kinase